jgi:hypothetical protein
VSTAVSHCVSELAARVLSQTERLRTVELSTPKDILLPESNVLEGISGDAPLLREFHLSKPSGTSWLLPTGLFRGGAPSLRHLTVSNVNASWMQLPLHSGIVHLSLECSSPRPPIHAFFESLAKLTSLKSLAITNWLPEGLNCTASTCHHPHPTWARRNHHKRYNRKYHQLLQRDPDKGQGHHNCHYRPSSELVVRPAMSTKLNRPSETPQKTFRIWFASTYKALTSSYHSRSLSSC